MKSLQTPSDYWRSNADLAHITPPGERFPEIGLHKALQEAVRGSVFEFGCGDGRLSPLFHEMAYTGFDINPAALAKAREANPAHRYTDDWADADTFLAYTVLLHVPDDEIQAVIDRAKVYKRVVIGEITGRKWRRTGNPPVFNREIADYEALIGGKCEVISVPYPRYKCSLDLMIWDKADD